MTREQVALFLGSGFSAEFELPLGSQLQEQLLEFQSAVGGGALVESFISRVIAGFWADVFGWKANAPRPSLEDHFTEIDLAANTGHYLGFAYAPKKLRAVRRMTIHRIFQLLNVTPTITPPLLKFLRLLNNRFRLSVVTTNWDTVIEQCLEHEKIDFACSNNPSNDKGVYFKPTEGSVLVSKLHGSSNWGYCDCCRNLYLGDVAVGKLPIHDHFLLQPSDFELFCRPVLSVRLYTQTADKPLSGNRSSLDLLGFEIAPR